MGPVFEQRLDVLQRCARQTFHIEFVNTPQSKASTLLPEFAFSAFGFDPDLAFAHGFAISGGLVIGGDPIQQRLMDRMGNSAPDLAGGTLTARWTGFADIGLRPLQTDFLVRVGIIQAFALRTDRVALLQGRAALAARR